MIKIKIKKRKVFLVNTQQETRKKKECFLNKYNKIRFVMNILQKNLNKNPYLITNLYLMLYLRTIFLNN